MMRSALLDHADSAATSLLKLAALTARDAADLALTRRRAARPPFSSSLCATRDGLAVVLLVHPVFEFYAGAARAGVMHAVNGSPPGAACGRQLGSGPRSCDYLFAEPRFRQLFTDARLALAAIAAIEPVLAADYRWHTTEMFAALRPSRMLALLRPRAHARRARARTS